MAWLLLGVVALCSAGESRAQSSPDGKVDKTGTNPTVLSRSFNLSNEHRALPLGGYFNTTTLRYTEPLADGRMSARLEMPTIATNALGGAILGSGDISFKWAWVAHLDRRQGLVVTSEIAAPTANNALLGTAKWVISPGFAYVYFLNKEVIVAPALVHNQAFAGDSRRQHVSRTDFDLYTVYRPAGQSWWLTSDVAISRDFVAQTTPASWKVAVGTTIARLGDGVVNLNIKPGIGIGPDRPSKWSIEVGLAVVGF